MKMRLLTALVAAGCFSQVTVANAVGLTTGSISNQTTATATVTLNQPITLENTLTPESGLKVGQEATPGELRLAKGKLAIKEAGVKARLALKAGESETVPFTVYATGHENDDEYKLAYAVLPTDRDYSAFDDFLADGYYFVKNDEVNSLDYDVVLYTPKAPKAGSYVVSATGAVYNP